MTFMPFLYFQLLKLHSLIFSPEPFTFIHLFLLASYKDVVDFSPVFFQGNRGFVFPVWLTHISFSLHGLGSLSFSDGIFYVYDSSLGGTIWLNRVKWHSVRLLKVKLGGYKCGQRLDSSSPNLFFLLGIQLDYIFQHHWQLMWPSDWVLTNRVWVEGMCITSRYGG